MFKNSFKKQNNLLGLTLVEVVVAAVIFTLVGSGLLATISALSRPADENTQDLAAAYFAKEVLSDLRTQLNAQEWEAGGTFELKERTLLNQKAIAGITYNAYYMVRSGDFGGRDVFLNIEWQ